MKCFSVPPHPVFQPNVFVMIFIKDRYFHRTFGTIISCWILLPRTSSSNKSKSVGKVLAGTQGHCPSREGGEREASGCLPHS